MQFHQNMMLFSPYYLYDWCRHHMGRLDQSYTQHGMGTWWLVIVLSPRDGERRGGCSFQQVIMKTLEPWVLICPWIFAIWRNSFTSRLPNTSSGHHICLWATFRNFFFKSAKNAHISLNAPVVSRRVVHIILLHKFQHTALVVYRCAHIIIAKHFHISHHNRLCFEIALSNW